MAGYNFTVGSWIANTYMSNVAATDLAGIKAAAPWMAASNLLSNVFNVLGSAYAAKAQAQAVKYQYQMQAESAQFQADVGRLNAQIAAYEGTQKQIQFAQNAALSGFQAAQTMANTRVQQSHSGVRMDSTSSQQVRANQQFSRAVDMATTEQNRVNLLNQSQQQVTNYLTTAGLSQASANTANAAANSISTQGAFNSALVNGLFGVIGGEVNNAFGSFSNELMSVDLVKHKYGITQWDVGTANTLGNNGSGWGTVSAGDKFKQSSNSGFGIGIGIGSGMTA